MKPRIVLTLFITAIAFVATGVAQSRSANDLFQEAWRFQEAKGDLAKAIDLYKTLVDRYPNAAVAPKALIELAGCYEKLGRPEAADVYQQIVSRYSSSGAPAASARARLAAMDQKSGPVVTARRVWDGSSGAYGGVSPDGRFITTVNWDTGALAVHELSSGKDRDLTAGNPLFESWKDFAEDSRPSPDGRSIAYVWYVEDGKRIELRVIPSNGGPFRVVDSNEAANISVWAWTSDGRAILETKVTLASGSGAARTRRTQTLFLIPVNGGSAKQIKQFAVGEAPGHFAISPDGHYVAYDLPAAADRPERDLFLVSVKDGVVTSLAQHQADDRMLSWVPDGSGIFFCSDRTGTFGIWTMNISNGQSAGAATLVKSDTGLISPLGFTRNREFYYETSNRDDDISIATIDPATGKQTGTPARLEGRYIGGKAQGVWSPDGGRLAYLQDVRLGPARATPPPGWGPAWEVSATDWRLAVHTLATGDVRLFDLQLPNFGYPAWSRDGRSVIVHGAEPESRQGLIQIDVEKGTKTPVVLRQGPTESRRFSAAVAPDGRSVFFHLLPAAGNVIVTDEGGIALRELASGAERIVVAGRVTAFAISPDGRWIAKTNTVGGTTVPNHLVVIPGAGGEPKPLAAGVADWKVRGSVAWSPDSRFVYVVRTDLPDSDEIVQVPVDGSAPRRTGILWRGTPGASTSTPTAGGSPSVMRA